MNPTPPVPEPDPVVESYKRDVDRTLIRENLKLSYGERLEKLAAFARDAEELKRAGQAARKRT